ncbi:MAG: hypothetical protein ACE5I1_33195, partial [bacterium]
CHCRFMQKPHAPRPQFSEQDAIRIAAEMYGVTPENMKELPSDRDQNFYLKTAHGLEFTLKIANSDTQKEGLDLQNRRWRMLPENLAHRAVRKFVQQNPARR